MCDEQRTNAQKGPIKLDVILKVERIWHVPMRGSLYPVSLQYF